jgi:DNA mismatch repair protein MutS
MVQRAINAPKARTRYINEASGNTKQMFQEYIELYKTYTQKYGQKTAIFLMVGSFYELYELQNQETGECRTNVRDLVDFLGCQVSIKKDVEEGWDGLVAGFPDYVMHKWAGRLTSAGWTVVIVDQVKDAKGKVKERKVSRILSPSTHIENTTSNETPYVATLYFQQQSLSAPSYGVGVLDLTTGSTHTYSGQASGRGDIWTADDLVQLLSVFQPKEVIMYWKGETSPLNAKTAARIFGISQSIPLHIRQVDTLGAFGKELVRTEYLQKIYNIKSILPPKPYLGLRSESEELALLFLLQFVEEHYPSMLKAFQRNEPWQPHTRLICGNHALTQLQMTGQNANESVIGLFDKCITPMGKRAIRDRLLSPYSDAAEIRNRLNEVQEYIIWPEDKTKILERQLRFMFDLPRLHRKILCGLITPQEIAGLFQTYGAIQVIMSRVVVSTSLKEPFSQTQWTDYMHAFQANFTEEKAQKANQDMSAFNIQKYPDIGKKEKEIQDTIAAIYRLRKDIATQGGVQEDAIRIEEREKEPYGLKGSTITIQQLKKHLKKLPDGTKISELKSGGWIDCTDLQQLNIQLQRQRESLDNLVRVHMPDACLEIAEGGQQIWPLMEFWIAHVDCTQCIGRVSKERAFSCPIIEDVDENGSAVDIKSIRHPLVEATSSRVAYVKHDVRLSNSTHTSTDKTNQGVGGRLASPQGWLVYGMNASGKSTLMKATGLCVLLAQAGCFVPAKEMTLRPFKAIYTRILNQDNLFAGLSSFAVEMSELRDILKNANQYTLVLGDELCSGTESISAQALVASGIQWLSARNAKFIFATHLHDLPNVINTMELGVEVWHLHVEYDPTTKKLVYDRSLRPGSGSTLYGLEVARAMDLPFEFIEQALKNRHQIVGSTTQLDATQSAWNTAVIRKECEVCHKSLIRDLEVHHIIPRAQAKNGVLNDGTHMNNSSNLIVICSECHDKTHAGDLEIGEVKQTSDGPEREIRDTSPSPQKKKSKWTQEEQETIVNTLKKYSTLSLKSLRAQLSSKHEIDISEAVLGKMRKEL